MTRSRKQTTEIKWDAEAAEKGGFEHFMMKEIHEQPKAVQDTLNSVIRNGAIDLSSVEINEDEIKNFEQIYIVACGSAWHVGMAAQYVLEDMADIPVRVELASEFRYRKMPVDQKALVIVVSQSGETADTLAALRLAKEKGIATMAIVNVVGSSIAREADKVFCHTCWSGDFCCYDQGIQRTACGYVLSGCPVCKKSEERLQTSSMATIFLSCRPFRRRCRRFWKIKNVSSGLPQSMPMPMMYSLWAVVLTMRFVWKAV